MHDEDQKPKTPKRDADPMAFLRSPEERELKLRGCPKCKVADWRTVTNQFGVYFICNACGNEWQGGLAPVRVDQSGLRPDPLTNVPVPADPDEELPADPYTGSSFRDPRSGFLFGDDE